MKIDIFEYEDIKKLFTEEELKHININDVYEVFLDGVSYYHIFDLEDGDFVGIDIKKNIYKITHDKISL